MRNTVALRLMPNLRDGACQVWWARRAPVRQGLLQVLDAVERDRLNSFVRVGDRERFVLGSAVTRHVLGGHLSIAPRDVILDRTCPDCGQPHGKVRLRADERVELSVSHSGEFVVVAFHFGGTAVGVDIQSTDSRLDPVDLSALVLAEAELMFLRSLHPAARAHAFVKYWTRKEAVVKATGDGLRASLPDITVTSPDLPAALLGWAGQPGFVDGAQLHDLDPGPGYSGALALLCGTAVPVRHIDADVMIGW